MGEIRVSIYAGVSSPGNPPEDLRLMGYTVVSSPEDYGPKVSDLLHSIGIEVVRNAEENPGEYVGSESPESR